MLYGNKYESVWALDKTSYCKILQSLVAAGCVLKIVGGF